MKTRKQPSFVPAICFTVIFGIAAIVLLIVGLVLMQDDSDTALFLLVCAGICFVTGFILLIFIIIMKLQRAIQQNNFSNPESIASKVMGENSNFQYFEIIPNARSQKAGNVAVNVAGVASAVFLGVGFFKWGKTSLDAFLSEDELIINTANSANFDDSNFTCYKSEEITDLTFESLADYERINITFTGDRSICFDISKSQHSQQEIRDAFGKLFKKPVQSEDVFSELQSAT